MAARLNIEFVYTITDPRHGYVIYVGRTVNFEKRKRQHLQAKNGDVLKVFQEIWETGLHPYFEIVYQYDSDKPGKRGPSPTDVERDYIRKHIHTGYLLNKQKTKIPQPPKVAVGVTLPESIVDKLGGVRAVRALCVQHAYAMAKQPGATPG